MGLHASDEPEAAWRTTGTLYEQKRFVEKNKLAYSGGYYDIVDVRFCDAGSFCRTC